MYRALFRNQIEEIQEGNAEDEEVERKFYY
jgi:hypothetical protein